MLYQMGVVVAGAVELLAFSLIEESITVKQSQRLSLPAEHCLQSWFLPMKMDLLGRNCSKCSQDLLATFITIKFSCILINSQLQLRIHFK